ncbi:HPr(Ser) kinase/phosphatase [Massiliimalia massiliensis]|uniref:HPr(Ser) kinase/phosphatase n=1 Tax=Massiliimalia massiliensis TaxID=1852384 RepID=UPI0009842904|nr:HPr(Ser) kinase/phosphatase [Massiliimalia massiliensis]
MGQTFTVPLKRIIKEFKLETIYMPESKEDTLIQSADINRPGINLTGFFEYFDNKRIQIMGLGEYAYLRELSDGQREIRINNFFQRGFPCIVFARGLEIFPEILLAAEKYEVIVLRTPEPTSSFMSGLISFLNVELAPRITRHGVLIEIYGEGVLLLGDSGVGKSETAIELVKRGHRLVADDAVEIRRVSDHSLVGSSPENIRHFLELRGIGIINARRLFGMGSVKVTEKINMVVKLEVWDPEKIYDRMGMEDEFTTILGLKIPSHTIPVKPGRNLAIILEVAAMNNRQKKMGYNAAQELMQNLGMTIDNPQAHKNWDFY